MFVRGHGEIGIDLKNMCASLSLLTRNEYCYAIEWCVYIVQLMLTFEDTCIALVSVMHVHIDLSMHIRDVLLASIWTTKQCSE